MDWFFDRIVRDRVVPIPGDGTQLVALSHVDDVASIIAAAVGNEKAHKQVFNCGTDKFVSYNSLCKAIAKAASFSNPKITYYDPKKLDNKPTFPFRATTFTLDPTKAKTELGWAGSTHKLLTMVRKGKGQEPPKGDVMIWYEQYVAMGLDKTPFDSTEDDAIVNSLNRVA